MLLPVRSVLTTARFLAPHRLLPVPPSMSQINAYRANVEKHLLECSEMRGLPVDVLRLVLVYVMLAPVLPD